MAHLEAALQACSSLSRLRQIHAHLIAAGLFQTAPSLRCKLLDLCAVSPFGDVRYATLIFDRIRRPATNDWNAILRGLARGPDPLAAVALFAAMARPGGAKDDALSCSFALLACARAGAAREPALLHARLLRRGFAADLRLRTTLVDAYAKSGAISAARKVFDEMPRRDVPTWNALIHGLAAGARPGEALALFRAMAGEPAGPPPDSVTVLGALAACAQLGDLAAGDSVRQFAARAGLDNDARVRNSLVDMYAKCGSIAGAVEVFAATPPAARSLVSWNSVIAAMALHGQAGRAFRLFQDMSERGIEPDAVTYLGVLSACNHGGMVEEGLSIFKAMAGERNVKHYGCVVDMLGRAGRVEEAFELVAGMAGEPDVVLWQTLLGACKTHGDVARAELAAAKLEEMGSGGDGDFVLLSNVYAAAQRWRDVGRVRAAMAARDLRKVPGFSAVQVGGAARRFVNGGLREHAGWAEILRKVEEMRGRVAELGYAAATAGNVLHDVLEEDKEEALWHHSERLAMAMGLVAGPPAAGEEIVVVKNLRICNDCHAVAKLVSRAYGRVVVVRDRARFHRFEGGVCSCGDYW
ncbi:pentatricopeptide repeat-containing protein OGR1, mitochondrial-like [Wolffia australiana]